MENKLRSELKEKAKEFILNGEVPRVVELYIAHLEDVIRIYEDTINSVIADGKRLCQKLTWEE